MVIKRVLVAIGGVGGGAKKGKKNRGGGGGGEERHCGDRKVFDSHTCVAIEFGFHPWH
jgi:hypothetical protein